MKILSEYPPNFDKISDALPGANKEAIKFINANLSVVTMENRA